jgi:hypothetical protein
MTVTFVWEIDTPEDEPPLDCLVVFDTVTLQVVSVTEFASGYPLDPDIFRLIKADIGVCVELADHDWKSFIRSFRVRPIRGA